MTRLIGLLAATSLPPHLDSRPLAAVTGGVLGLLLGRVAGRGVLRVLGSTSGARR